MCKFSHRIVFSSSWSRVEQAMKMDDDWQQQAQSPTNYGQNKRHRL